MKLKSILSIFAIVALSAACTREEPVSNPDQAVKLSPSLFTISQDGGVKEIKLEATEDWCVWFDAEWVSITPKLGGASVADQVTLVPSNTNVYFFKPGSYTVDITVAPNKGKERTAQIVFDALGPDKKTLTITQDGGETIPGLTPDDPMTCVQAIAYCKGLDDKAKSSKQFYVKGIIVDIVEEFGTQYGNATFWITDDGKKDSPKFEVYRCYYFDNVKYSDTSLPNIHEGDQVIVYGLIMNYGGQAETSQNEAYLYSLEAGSTPSLKCTEPEIAVAASATSASFEIVANNLTEDWTVTTDAGWITDFTRSGHDSGTIEVQFDANTDTENRTAVFTVKTAGVEDVTLTLVQGGYTESGTLAKPYTIAEAIAALKEGPVAGNVYVKGIISNTTKYNYGGDNHYNTASFWLSDDGIFYDNLDMDFEAYSVYWLGGDLDNPTPGTDIKANFVVGDEVIIYGQLTAYTKDGKTTYETASKKAKIYSLNWALTDENGVGNVDYPFNVAGAKAFIDDTQAAIAAAKAQGETLEIPDVAVGGKASKIEYAFDSSNKTGTFWLSDDGVFNDDKSKDFEAYKVYWLENLEWEDGFGQVNVGDDVIVKGQLTAYTKNDVTTYETSSKKAYVYSLNGVTEASSEPVAGGMSIDGDFSDWESVEDGLYSDEGPLLDFRATSDADYLYFYSKRTWHDGLWKESSGGYYYFELDLDNDPSTGTNDVNGNTGYGVEAWMYLYLFTGSADAPTFASNPAGSAYPSDSVMANVIAAGSTDKSVIETEVRVPRANLGVQSGQTIRIYTWGNKSASNLKAEDSFVVLTLE